MHKKIQKDIKKYIKSTEDMRLDKWLWAARLYKTRALASDAINGGKVHYNGQCVKSSKAVTPNAVLQIKQGLITKTLVVTALSMRRGSAVDAAQLYIETAESLAMREQATSEQRMRHAAEPDYGKRPDKKMRRKIHQFKHQEINNE